MDNQNFNQSNMSNYQAPPVVSELKPKKKRHIFYIILIAVIALVVGSYFLPVENETGDESDEQYFINDTGNNIFASVAFAKRLIKPEDTVSGALSVDPRVPAYSLPLDVSKDIANWNELNKHINLSSSAKKLLSKNGFVAMNEGEQFSSKEDFASFYSEIQNKDLPVFITTDSLLHYYHIFFDTSLMRMEKDIFYDDVWQMSKKFYDDSLNIYQSSDNPLVKEAAKRNVAYLATALELLKPKPEQIVSGGNVKKLVDCYANEEYCKEAYEDAIKNGTFSNFGQREAEKYSFSAPDFAKDLVSKELQLVADHEGWDCSPVFLYEEDYSQYVPRGHYTKTEKLKNYFKAFMWYGRMTSLINGSVEIGNGQCVKGGMSDGFISSDDAKIQTLQAAILARKFAADIDIQKIWEKIYAITAFYVGFSDDLGPVEYGSAVQDLFGSNADVNSLASGIADIKEAIDDKFAGPQVYGGLGNAKMIVIPKPPLTEDQIGELKRQADQLLANTKGFRMMGQRFVVDSYLFSKIVSPYSGEYNGPDNREPFTYVVTETGRKVRGFPIGLDIMALLGSERAGKIIEDSGDADYSDYDSQFNNLKKGIDNISQDDWHQNLYWNWLYVLKALIAKFGDGYPTFMQTDAWQDKELNTALASWSELRHDTILYAKQSYTMAEKGGGGEEPKIVGYVEPVPVFYARLLDLTKMTKKGLTNLLEQDEWNKVGVGDAMDQFETILARLADISKTELENRELSDNDYNFIKYFGESLKSMSSRLLSREGDIDHDMFKTTLVADVHTDGNTEKVLEEGTGYIRPIIVAYKLPGEYILVGVGPIFSYYEFKQPMEERLTDEKWRNILQTNPPSDPQWTKSFSE